MLDQNNIPAAEWVFHTFSPEGIEERDREMDCLTVLMLVPAHLTLWHWFPLH